MLQDGLASVPPHRPTFADQSTSVTLERHRHSHQLSTNTFPCATVFGCVVSRSCQERTMYLSLGENHSGTAAEREKTKRDDGFLNLARIEKHASCPSFWKFECYQHPPSCWKASSTRCVDSRIKQRCSLSLSWILYRTCVKLCTSVKKQILSTSLSLC